MRTLKSLQIPDRYPNITFSSIAATGFGLSAYLVGIDNGYITREQGAERILKTLKTLWELPQDSIQSGIAGYKGFFYHFLNTGDALRFKQVELSSIDTGLLMAGVLTSMSYFDNETDTEKQIRDYADKLYRRVDWSWMMTENNRLSMGWHPEKGFLASEWAGYNEAMVLLIMAIGSPTHPIPASAWSTWCSTYPIETFYGQKNVQFDPLFGHQYSQMFIDFKGIQDSVMAATKMDYFENSKRATLSNRSYCIANPKGFIGYGENNWGLTACDGPHNGTVKIGDKEIKFMDYSARGACTIQIVDDGTIAPTAAGGSFPFTPELSENALAYMWNTYRDKLVSTYGFKDAFNLTFKDEMNPNGWFDEDYLGIDQGPIIIQIANHENGLIWNTMKKNPYMVEGLRKAGFKGGWLNQ